MSKTDYFTGVYRVAGHTIDILPKGIEIYDWNGNFVFGIDKDQISSYRIHIDGDPDSPVELDDLVRCWVDNI